MPYPSKYSDSTHEFHTRSANYIIASPAFLFFFHRALIVEMAPVMVVIAEADDGAEKGRRGQAR